MTTGCFAARAGRYGKRPRIRRITPEQFREIREFTGKGREDVAEFLGVSLRTVGHWETGRARVPYAAFRLLRLALRGDILDPAWQDYRIVRGRLVTPEGYAFGPGDLAWLSLLVQRANFASLAALGAVTMRSGGRCAVDRQSGRAASSGAGEGDSSPASADSSVGLPFTNRGVSETEREARQGPETRTATAFDPDSGRLALPAHAGPEWGHNGAIQSTGGFAHDGISQAQFAASSGSVRTGSGGSLGPAHVVEHVHPAGAQQLPPAHPVDEGQAFGAERDAFGSPATTSAKRNGTRRGARAASASPCERQRSAPCAKGRTQSALSMRKPQGVQALPRRRLKSGGAA